MDKNKQLFTYDSIDDDIDYLINNQLFISSNSDARLVDELRQIYKEDAQSLKRVWMRLEQTIRDQSAVQELSPKMGQGQKVSSHNIVNIRRNNRKAKYPTSRLFTVLAAALVGFFLVSSLAWILAMTYPATPGASRDITALPPQETSNNPSQFVELTVHNDKSGQTNYITMTDGNNKPLIPCQPVQPLNWADVLSWSDTPAKIPTGQIIRLQYFSSPKCDPPSRLLFVDLPIPIDPVHNHCWFNPDNTTTPNWSGCVEPSQILSINWH
jgi:hypothetical protein